MVTTGERRGSSERGASEREVAPGVYRFGAHRVNWYVVADDAGERLTVVDAGLPAHWNLLVDGLEGLGYDLDDVAALVLTHGHPDHVGFAERLRSRGVTVHAHEADRDRFESGGGAIPRDLLRNLWRPRILTYFVGQARGGAASIDPIGSFEQMADGEVLDVPGSPEVRHLPGHTPGQCVLVLADREVVLAGDALATTDLRRRGGDGPQVLFIADDHDLARESLARLEDLGEVVLLPGHGEPWAGEASEAVELARER
jgi:glyoxylase-like metal-dependent hydrolase (beta-lactamase superfamily II)